MKAVFVTLVLLAALAAHTHTQEIPTQSVYTPYTQEEVQSVTLTTTPDILPDHPQPKPHHKNHKKELKHGGYREEEIFVEDECKFETIKLRNMVTI
jgi:hypothetical protein